MTSLLGRLRALLRRSADSREMDEELRYHVEQQVAHHVASGMAPGEARTAALRSLGGMERRKDEMRDARGIGFVEHTVRDLRHAWRAIGRMPLTALVIVVSLAIGIGANATIFSWIQLVLLRPLPGVRDASQLQLVGATTANGGNAGSSWLEYRDLQRLTAFRDLAAYNMVPLNVGEAGRNERTFGQLVSGNYFRALGIAPVRGRVLVPADAEQPGGAPVAVVSYRYWMNRLGGAEDVVGRSLLVNGRLLNIVGVAPEGFQGTVLGLDFQLWVPATMTPVLFSGSRQLEERGQRGFHLVSHLNDGTSQAAAQLEVDAAMAELARLYPASNENMIARVHSFWKAPTGPPRFMANGLLVLQGIMLLLLLAVCGNTINLLLARASTRQREMGTRLALGAGRRRIMSLVLSETLLLVLPAAGLGTLLAMWGTNAVRAVPFIGTFPIRFHTEVDGVTLAFAIGLALLCGLAFGLAPALLLSRTDPQVALRAGFGPVARGRTRGALMGVEVALAMVVLVAGGLFFRGLRESRSDTGFRQAGLLLVGYDLSSRNASDSALLTFTDRLLQRVKAIPSVAGAAIAASVPLDIHGLPLRSFRLEGRSQETATAERALSNVVTPGYFDVMGIALRAGSDFAALGDRAAPPQAIVNEEFVRRYLDGAEPLGRRVYSGSGREYVIVGVAANSLYDAFGDPPRPCLYYSYRDVTYDGGQLHISTQPGSESALAAPVERAVRDLDPALPVYDVRTMSEHIDKNLFLRKIPARMFVVLGPLLLVLAAIGIYAVVDYAVARRSHEIGLRLALGASRKRIIGQLIVETLRPVGYGALAGLFVALLVAMHVAQGVISAPVFLGVPALLVAVAALACWVPARRAAGVDPMVALRRE